MDRKLNEIQKRIYDNCGFEITGFTVELESKEYAACRFDLNGQHILSRNAKVTPKKIGQFVTFWKRNDNRLIAPFDQTDTIDFYVVNVQIQNRFGQFVFPKSVLTAKGIISTENKEGKRAFRVYPCWDIPTSKQAKRTQEWQLDYFYELNPKTNITEIINLYKAVQSTKVR